MRGNDTAEELAEPYFYYGQALLYLGLSEQQVFGSDIVKGERENERDWRRQIFAGDNCIDTDNDENEDDDDDVEEAAAKEEKKEGTETVAADESIPDDEHVNDLERAFEILECAHMIYSKMLEIDSHNAHIITRLGDLDVMLADICNENGDHGNALSHVLKAIELQETINEQQRYRLLAESFYKLGLIYELINQFTDAVDSFDKAVRAVGQAIEQAHGDEKQSEREELQSLLPAIELKRSDAQASLADRHLIAQARNILSGASNGNSHTTDNSTADAPVKDLTMTIRHKRPATDVEKTDEESKKTKTDDD